MNIRAFAFYEWMSLHNGEDKQKEGEGHTYDKLIDRLYKFLTCDWLVAFNVSSHLI